MNLLRDKSLLEERIFDRSAAQPAGSEILMTRTGEKALREERARLRRELEVDLARRLREARQFGEPAGNDEYLQIQEEEAVLASRLARLDSVLSRARVVDDASSDGLAMVGTLVEAEDLRNGKVSEYRLVGAHEPLSPGAVSAASPIGKAIVGRVPGDEVEVELPGGRKRRLRVRAVRAAP